MALEHAHAGEPWKVGPLGPSLASTQSFALFKTTQLEVIHLVLQQGKAFAPHQVAGDITLQCIEGSLIIEAMGTEQRLLAGHLMYLPGHVRHAVRADQDASALLTIVLPPR